MSFEPLTYFDARGTQMGVFRGILTCDAQFTQCGLFQYSVAFLVVQRFVLKN